MFHDVSRLECKIFAWTFRIPEKSELNFKILTKALDDFKHKTNGIAKQSQNQIIKFNIKYFHSASMKESWRFCWNTPRISTTAKISTATKQREPEWKLLSNRWSQWNLVMKSRCFLHDRGIFIRSDESICCRNGFESWCRHFANSAFSRISFLATFRRSFKIDVTE